MTGYAGNDVIYQMGGGFDHAPCARRRVRTCAVYTRRPPASHGRTLRNAGAENRWPKSRNRELAEYNIAVNCITPAAAKTRIFDQVSEEHIQYMLGKIPRGRFLRVEEAASMVAWLCSEENSFTTGAAFDLSGGRCTY